MQEGPEWTVDLGRLSPGTDYTVLVTVIKGPVTSADDAPDASADSTTAATAGRREASASLRLVPTNDDVPMATIRRFCGVEAGPDGAAVPRPCPALHNPSEPLALVAALEDG